MHQRKQDIRSLGTTLIELACGDRKERNLPQHFSKEAKRFVETCAKAYAHWTSLLPNLAHMYPTVSSEMESISELIHHPWLSEDEATLTHEGVFIPLSPASSNPGFSMDYDFTSQLELHTQTNKQDTLLSLSTTGSAMDTV